MNNTQIKISLKDSYLGFTDDLIPRLKARTENILEKKYRYDGEIKTRKQFVYDALLEGYKPFFEKYEEWNRNGERVEKESYRLKNENGYFSEITKTEYDFANYLIENDLLDNSKAILFLENEAFQKKEQERIRLEQEQKEKEAEELNKKLQREKNDKERQEKIKQWKEKGMQFVTDDIKEFVIEAFKELYKKSLAKNYTRHSNENDFVNNHLNIFYMEFGNEAVIKNTTSYVIDQLQSGKELTDSYLTIWKIYKYIFKLNENDGKRTITAKINAFYKGKEYKGTQQPKTEKTYYISKMIENEIKYIEVLGREFKNEYGLELFVYKKGKEYILTEVTTGFKLTSGHTLRELKENFKKNVENRGIDSIKSIIKSIIEKHGRTPEK